MAVFQDLSCLTADCVVVTGRFFPEGAGAIVNSKNEGGGYTVARTNAGEYTVTFNDKFASFVSCNVTLQLNAADEKYLMLGAWTASTRKLIIYAWDVTGAAATDINAAYNANDSISFVAVFK